MRLLAIDTTTSSTGAAIYTWNPDSPRGSREGTFEAVTILEEDQRQAEALIPILDGMVKEAGLTPKDIDAFACAKGPGSFTGLRIGVTMAKTMAQFSGKPVVGISSLAALAMEAGGAEDFLRVPVIDARANRIFAAAYPASTEEVFSSEVLLPEALYYQEDFLDKLTRLVEEGAYSSVVFSGKGMAAHPYLVDQANFPTVVYQGEGRLSPIRALARLAAARLDLGQSDSILDLAPNYLRKSQAELDRSRHGNRG